MSAVKAENFERQEGQTGEGDLDLRGGSVSRRGGVEQREFTLDIARGL